jgi:hypothetical protein
MKINGFYLLCGPNMMPKIGMLTKEEQEGYERRLSEAAKYPEKPHYRLQAIKVTFRVGAHWATPCWIDKCMETVIQHFVSSDPEIEKATRGMAACVLNGIPWGGKDLTEGKIDIEGGQQAPIDPVKPKPRKPSGGNAVKPQMTRSQLAAERQALRMEATQR